MVDPLFLVTKRRVLENLLDQGVIDQTLQFGSSFCNPSSSISKTHLGRTTWTMPNVDTTTRKISLKSMNNDLEYLIKDNRQFVMILHDAVYPKESRKEPLLFPSDFATFLSWTSENFEKSMVTSPSSRSLFDMSVTVF
jgi:hypothetical protein